MITDWIKLSKIKIDKKLNFNTGNFLLEISGKKFLFLTGVEEKVIDKELKIQYNEFEAKIVKRFKVDFFLFYFGNRYYTHAVEKVEEKVEFEDFLNIGEPDFEFDIPFVHLGVHGEYESLNGNHTYDMWVDKAFFFKQKALGICEKNTLAGALAFQVNCSKKNIKPIIGETFDVKIGNQKFELKAYCLSEFGWKNLLAINAQINVFNHLEKVIYFDDLITNGKDVVLVISPESLEFVKTKLNVLKESFHSVYYQIDATEYLDDIYDIAHLKLIKKYLSVYSKELEPIFIQDSYYLESFDHNLKSSYNIIGKISSNQSENEYFKSVDDIMVHFVSLFNPEKKFRNGLDLIETLILALSNTVTLSEMSNFEINIGQHKLPEFEAVGEIDYKNGNSTFVEDYYHDTFGAGTAFDNKKLFFSLIEIGIRKKLKNKPVGKYLERVETECDVIVNAGFIDYFLILWDIVREEKLAGGLVGPARGSVGGSLIAYLLDITDIDPIEYDLLFERFLNKTRVSGERAKAADALPDIDIDFESQRRDKVKEYMELKYGKDYVVSIGTYTRLKLKSALKDLAKVEGLSFKYINFITSLFPDKQASDYSWHEIFEKAIENDKIYDFVQKNGNIINLLKRCLMQTRASSVHPSAVVIVPKLDGDNNKMNVFSWMPVRLVEGMLVSEWEGKYIERAGFLKEDILGISQLDKFKMILNLVEKNRGKKIKLSKIPMNYEPVFNLFKKGQNEDVFQFGTSGISAYCKKLKPDNIEELTAINALYRPGPMESNAHNDFVSIKFKKKKPEYDFGLKEVTEKTFGLYIYQEQIMKAVHVLGGLSLSQADEIRTVMKKFDQKKMATFQEMFIEGATSKGCSEKEAEKIWEKLERFSRYGFNRSHSAAYSIIGYWCQFLKYHYPLEFYTTSFQYAGENDIANLISEIRNNPSNKIKIVSPDINVSTETFVGVGDSIYWSLAKIKNVGVVGVGEILKERELNGKFFTFEEFYSRTKINGKINKKVIESLIIGGAFDKMENVQNPRERMGIIRWFYDEKMIDLPEEYKTSDANFKDHFWVFKQKELTGFGDVDYKTLIKGIDNSLIPRYLESKIFLSINKDWKDVCIAGRVMYVKERPSKKGKFGTVTLDSNSNILVCIFWSKEWVLFKEEIESSLNKVVILSGKIKFDDYKGMNVLFANDKTKMYAL